MPTIEGFLSGARRRWWIVAITAIAALGGAIAFTDGQEKLYSASSSVQFKDNALVQNALGVATPAAADPAVFAATNTQTLSESPVVERVAQTLSVKPSELRDKVQIASRTGTSIVNVTATDSDPRRAAYIATTYARVFVNLRRRQQRSDILSARDVLRRQLESSSRTTSTKAQRSDLRQRIAQLGILASIQNGGVVLSAPAEVPAQPATPGPLRNGVLGLLAGFVAGLALALFAERIDQKVRFSDEYELEFGRSLLGTMPRISRRRDPIEDPDAQASVELLRVNLGYAGLPQSLKTIAVISAVPQEGKSSLATLLAMSLARVGSSVLLVDADLRKRSLSARLGTPAAHGLSDVLAGLADPEDAFVVASQDPRRGASGVAGYDLAFLSAGTPAPNPGDLIESDAMAEFLKWARDRFDVVVLDTPASLAVPDTLNLLPYVDGALVVGRLGISRRDHVRALNRQLRLVNREPLGLALFAASRASSGSGYGYAGYGPSTAASRPTWSAWAARTQSGGSEASADRPPERPAVRNAQ